MTPDEELLRADKAQQVLSNPAYGEAVQEIHNYILDLIVQTDDTDTQRFHSLGLRLKQHHTLIRQLQTYMETGELVKEELERKKSLFSR